MSHASLLRWAALQEPGGQLTLVCAENPLEHAAPGAVRLEACAADAGWALPFELLAAGFGSVTIVVDGCRHRSALDARLTGWTRLAATLGRPGAVAVAVTESVSGPGVPPLQTHQLPGVSRRGILGLRSGPACDLTYEPDAAASDFARLRAAVQTLGADLLPGFPGPGLRLGAQGCTACGVCARVCAEDALVLAADGARAQLSQRPHRCSGCSDCLTVCEPHALATQEQWDWSVLADDDTVLLTEVAVEQCSRCHQQYAPVDGRALCPACSFRRAHPFGTALSPEALARLARRRPDHLRQENHG